MFKLWLDDVRPAPDGWHHVMTAPEAIEVLQTGHVFEVSLDHDLGDNPDAGDGYQVACWIEEHAHDHTLPPIHRMAIHSANPVGRARMQMALDSAQRAWSSMLWVCRDCAWNARIVRYERRGMEHFVCVYCGCGGFIPGWNAPILVTSEEADLHAIELQTNPCFLPPRLQENDGD